VGDPYHISVTLSYIGNVAAMFEEFEKAAQAYEESLRYAQSSQALTALASVLSSQGKYDEANIIRERAIALCQETGEESILAVNLNEQGVDYLERGYFKRSLE